MMPSKKIKILFMGRKPVAADCLSWLLECSNVEVVGVLTDSHLSVSPTSDIANENNLKIYGYDEAFCLINEKELDFDLGLSMLYWRILKEGFINTPKLGVVNFHPAPLPDFKGTAGYNVAILEGLEKWRVTAHYVDENVDTGPIINSLSLSISAERETAQSLEKRCQPLLFELFKSVVGEILSSESMLPTTPNEGGRYITRDEMEAMKEVKQGDDVARKIRAFWFPPYDGAYKIINGVKCTLIDRFILEELADKNSSSLFTEPSER